jgi:hypothetical protein
MQAMTRTDTGEMANFLFPNTLSAKSNPAINQTMNKDLFALVYIESYIHLGCSFAS